MNNLDHLLEKFKTDTKVSEVLSFTNKKGISNLARIKVPHLNGSHRSFFLSSLYLSEPRSVIYIANNKEETAYIQNDLDNLLNDKMVLSSFLTLSKDLLLLKSFILETCWKE